ncbi:YggS family pyridoxal phosphate-dependent enzyme [Tenacibaculum sp. C7A-26P2]|uniref:YggS family pyridoxal phosphate-dependent enzyme n=1 Tax=Tenacibaculum sp. C7A-26P2 TaxID=3447504 RepID=UPI003F84FC80
MKTNPLIIENINKIQHRIQKACTEANREVNEVRLLLATKTVSPENIKIALSKEKLIGENKIQEIKEKFDSLNSITHQKHFIGHLQSNKIKDILKYNVTCIQSVDRLSLAEKLQKRLVHEDKHIDILVQVNTSDEKSKFGISPELAINLIKEIALFDRIHIKGLMTIGVFSSNDEEVRKCFQKLKLLQQKIISENIRNVQMHELSMGMSGDLEIAIKEGATIIRVGTAIFGKRAYPDSYYWNENSDTSLKI